MVAYHFPPLAGSSGIQRTLRFVQQLPDLGWDPVVLSIQPKAYERTQEDLLRDIPAGVHVHRAFGLDCARHLAIAGRYPGFLARPDRWSSWRFDGIRSGLRLIRDHKVDAIWSTFPIATAHVIGEALHLRSGLPWIADFRDPMAQPHYPADPLTREQFHAIEARSCRAATATVTTTPGAARTYRARYPDIADRVRLIENGYDESSFIEAERVAEAADQGPLNPGYLTLLHSGIVYPSERDPRHLFAALALLRERQPELIARLRLRFRAAVHEQLLRELAQAHGLQQQLQIEPALPYRSALAEMVRADGLLVLQAANCNEQIPAKLYETLRAGRPILCLSDPGGDTVGVLRQAGLDSHAPLDDAAAIAALIQSLVQDHDSGRPRLAQAPAVLSASREARSRQLAALLDEVTATAPGRLNAVRP